MEIQAEQVILDLYDSSSGYPSWADITPQVSVNDGKLFIMKKGEWSVQQVFSRGISHLDKFDIADLPPAEQAQFFQPGGKGYNDVPKTNEILNLQPVGSDRWLPEGQSWPNVLNDMWFKNGVPLTEEQGYNKGNIADITYPVVIAETLENNHAASMHWPWWRPFWDRWKERLVERHGAANVWLGYDYLHGFIHNVLWMGRQQAKDMLRLPLNAWPGNNMLPGGPCQACDTGCYPIYLGAFDRVRWETFNLAYSCMVAHKAGKKQVAFFAPIHEQRPNNYNLMDLPNGGKFARMEKVPVSPATIITLMSVAYIFGDGAIGWGVGGKYTMEKRWSRMFLQGNELYYKPGETTPSDLSTFPYLTNSDRLPNYYTSPTGVEDMAGMTWAALKNTWGQTHGGTEYFVRLRVNGGSWIAAANNDADDLVDAQFDQRFAGRVRIKGNVMSWWICGPYADSTQKTVEFEHPTIPGQYYTVKVAGGIAKFGNINF